MKILTILYFMVFYQQIPNLTQADVNRGALKFPGLTLQDLTNGEKLYLNNCNSCHGFKHPTSRPENKWIKTVPLMVKKINKKYGTEKIDSLQQQLLLKYIITMSSEQKK